MSLTKTEVIRARVTGDEARVFSAFAKAERLNKSEALRALIRAGLRHYGLWPPQSEDETIIKDGR